MNEIADLLKGSTWELDDILPNLILLLAGILVYTPSLMYRYSLKATSLIYLPLLWIARGGPRKRNEQQYTFKAIEAEQLKRGYAWFVLLSLGSTLAYYLAYQRWYYPLETGQEFTQYFIPIEHVGSWHSTRIGAAVLTLSMAWLSRRALLRLEVDNFSDTKMEAYWLTVGSRLRFVCTFWTIGCGIYLAYHAVDWSTLPGWLWLPEPPYSALGTG